MRGAQLRGDLIQLLSHPKDSIFESVGIPSFKVFIKKIEKKEILTASEYEASG